MIGDLKPHAAYKDAGQDWLGSIPAHWSLLRAKRLFREVDERSKTGKEELLSVSHLTGVTPRRLKTVTMFMAESNVGHKVCCPGDLVINTLWAWMAALGVTRHTGMVSPAYGVYRPIAGGGILPAYADHLLRTPMYAAEYQRRSTGVNSSRLRLYPEQFLRVDVLVPPLDEQALIVRFLDWANDRLERTIRAKRKVIALLTEQKRAVTYRAVTRGIDDEVALKPSGVPWLGDIPQHWDVKPIKRLIQNGTTISYGIVQPGDHNENGVPFLQTTNISKPNLETEGLQRTTTAIAAAYPRTQLKAGDVVLGIRASIGAAHKIPQALVGVNLSRGVARIVPNAEISSDYLVQYLRSRATTSYWDYARQGTTFNEVAISSVRMLPVVVPPVPVQSDILEDLLNAHAPVDAAISRFHREIELLREYRARLVADVVTGKLDVREAAARLSYVAALDITTDLTTNGTDETELADEGAEA